MSYRCRVLSPRLRFSPLRKDRAILAPLRFLPSTFALQAATLAMCSACGTVAHAATYYVDSDMGRDSNDGTSISTPIKTINKVNTMILKPGDYVLFKKGQIWREQLSVIYSGTATMPITFGAYGDGNPPVISGADMVSPAWTIYTGEIYATTLSISTAPSYLYVDGTYYDVARYPDVGFINGVSVTADPLKKLSAIGLNITANDIADARIMAKTVSWLIGPAADVQSFDPSTQILTTKTNFSSYPMKAGFGFYLQNKLWMLNAAKEWYYDNNTRKIYVRIPGGDSPNNHAVEISTRPYGIITRAKSYIIINGLRVEKAVQSNVELAGGSNITVNAVDVFGGNHGIRIASTATTVQNSTISESASEGVETAIQSSDIHILNCSLYNNGYVGSSPTFTNGSIYINGTGVEIRGNVVKNSGFHGIRADGKDITIESNTVDSACNTLDDCGGIYTWGWGTPPMENVVIRNNIVTNMVGNLEGTPNTKPATRGIYLDTCAFGVTVTGNKVSNADYGIHVHSGSNNIISDNEFIARRRAIAINEDLAQCQYVSNNQVLRNKLGAPNTSDAPAYYYSTLRASADDFGTYDYNTYCMNVSQPAVQNQGKKYSLTNWQMAKGQDMHSMSMIGCTQTP